MVDLLICHDQTTLRKYRSLQIYVYALGFHVSENALGMLTRGPDVQLASQVVQANMHSLFRMPPGREKFAGKNAFLLSPQSAFGLNLSVHGHIN